MSAVLLLLGQYLLVLAEQDAAADVEALALQAIAWLDALPPDECVRCSSLLSAPFQWLST